MKDFRIFNTKDEEYVRSSLVEFLEDEAKRGNVEIIRNDKFELSNGVPVDVVEAKIAKGKRLRFQLFYGGFLLEGKSVSLSHQILSVGESSVFLDRFDLKGLDNISMEVAY